MRRVDRKGVKMELLRVDSVEKAREKLLSCVQDWVIPCETVTLTDAPGRILANDVFASEDIPAFRRSTVDGYAVLSKDTAAAGESIPVFLTVKSRVEMGAASTFTISGGECAEVPTGGMLPEGADAVVMVEYSEHFGKDGVALHYSAANGENTVSIGEDAREGELLLPRGKRLLPQDIGALAAAGVTEVQVYARLKMTVLSTGDELIPPEQKPLPGQIRDINTYALKALAEKNGFTVIHTAVIPDRENILEEAVRSAMEVSDLVAVSGGSSQGEKDWTRAVLDRASGSGVFTHGLAIKPGKPTILGYDASSQTLLAGLPGHPVSAMVVFELLFCRLIREMMGTSPPPAVPALLTCNVASSPGKLTCWPVRLVRSSNGYEAEPVFGKSGLITTLTRADGFFTIDRNKEGLTAGESVFVEIL